jgi:TolB protein
MRYLLVFLVAAAAYGDSQSATVSPDGKRIVFVSDRDGATDLYVMSADGSSTTRLTNTPEKESRADWSPDGKHVWFSVTGNDGSRIYSVDADGSSLREIGGVPGRSVRLSPDGKRTLYAVGSWTVMNLMVSNLDGSHTRMLNDGTSIAWGPQWSPRGKQIAYGSRDKDKHLNVWVMNADGSNAHQLTHIAGSAQMPAWSRDSKKIALQVDDQATKTARIWIVDAKTGDGKPIGDANGAYADEVPSWFPDGKRIVFQSNRTGRHEVWVMNVDGSGQQQLTH